MKNLNLWAIVEDRLSEKKILSMRHLEMRLQQVWNNIEIDWVKQLMDSFGQRLAHVRVKQRDYLNHY